MASLESPLTLNEAAEYLKCNPEVLRRWAASGKVKAGRIGKNWRFRRSQLDALVFGRNGQGRKAKPW